MLEKKYDDWCKVLKLDDISFCVELGLTLLESQAFKELVEEDETDDVDKKKAQQLPNKKSNVGEDLV